MRKMRGRKAQLDMIIFPIMGMLVGAVVIVVVFNLSSTLLKSGPEEVIAKDLALSLMTISASPSNINFRYIPNTEDYIINIKSSGELSVSSRKGSSKEKFSVIQSVQVQDETLRNQISIPLIYEGKKIFFSDIESEDNVYVCDNIPSYSKKNPDVSVEFDYFNINLKKIFEGMKLRSQQDDYKGLFELEEGITGDLKIKLLISNSDKTEIKYYYDAASNNFVYEKMACYLKINMEKLSGNLYEGVEYYPDTKVRGIEISIGGGSKYEQIELDSKGDLSITLSYMISNAIAKVLG